jgi:hypothetical protein
MEAYQVIERNIGSLKSIIMYSDYVRMMSMDLFTLADAKVVDVINTYLPNIILDSLDRCSYCRLSNKHPFISLTPSTKRFAHLAPPLPLPPPPPAIAAAFAFRPSLPFSCNSPSTNVYGGFSLFVTYVFLYVHLEVRWVHALRVGFVGVRLEPRPGAFTAGDGERDYGFCWYSGGRQCGGCGRDGWRDVSGRCRLCICVCCTGTREREKNNRWWHRWMQCLIKRPRNIMRH